MLSRVAVLLRAFDGPVSLTLVELTERSGLPRSTTHRLCEQLVGLGWLERVPSGYRVGLGLFELGSNAVQAHRLRDVAAPWLRQLHDQSRLTVHLATLEGDEVVCIDKVGVRGEGLPSRIGGRYQAQGSVIAAAIKSFEQVSPCSPNPCVSAADRPVAGPDSFRDGYVCVAAPVRGAGRAIAAVSVSGPLASIETVRHAALVKNAARGIWSDLFGGRRDA